MWKVLNKFLVYGKIQFSLLNGSPQKFWLQDMGPVLESLDLELDVLTREKKIADQVKKSIQTGYSVILRETERQLVSLRSYLVYRAEKRGAYKEVIY